MRKVLILLLVVSIGISFLATLNKIGSKGLQGIKKHAQEKKVQRVGEKITYQVQLGKISLGRSIFKHLPAVILEGKPVNVMTFETKLANFTDLEKIYSDPETYLPVRIERHVSTWPFPENITEEYDQANFTLTVHKLKAGKKQELVIKKDGLINNAILLPFYVRDTAVLQEGFRMNAKFPMQDFLIELTGKEEVVVPAGKFMAYHFTSTPKRFEIWISADERKIPLKIKGANGIGYTLSMRDYSM